MQVVETRFGFKLMSLALGLLIQQSATAQTVRDQIEDGQVESASSTDPSISMSDREISALITDLGSDNFRTRENATSQLLTIGQPALPQLQSVSDEDLEVEYRAGMIASRIERNQFEILSRNFLLDPNPKNSYGFPAWQPFAELVGHSRTSKLMFLDMLRLHPRLVETIDKLARQEDLQPDQVLALERQAASISSDLSTARMTQMHVPEIGDFTAILFAAALMPGQAPIEVNELLGMNAYMVPVTTHIRRRGYGPALKRLYSAWIPKSHASMALRVIGISLQFGLESGVVVARRNLSANLDARLREQAIHCLARFGDASDIALLVPLLDDSTIVHEFAGNQIPLSTLQRIEESNEPPPGLPQQDLKSALLETGSIVRINDLALAAICMLAKEEPESIFPGFVRHEAYGFDSRSIAVAKLPQPQAARRELIDEWKRRFSRSAG